MRPTTKGHGRAAEGGRAREAIQEIGTAIRSRMPRGLCKKFANLRSSSLSIALSLRVIFWRVGVDDHIWFGIAVPGQSHRFVMFERLDGPSDVMCF